jgi:branched-chain amino acid transport system substrate-binding protein
MKSHAIIAIIALVLLVGCAHAEKSIAIGAVFHLTGAGAFWGTGEHNAAQIAIEDINAAGGIDGKPLKLIVEDGKTDFPQTASAFRKLIDTDRVPIIIGPTWFGQVTAPIAEETKTAVLSPSTGPTVQRQKYFFNLWPTERQEIIPLVAYMKVQGVRKVAVVYSQNDWAASMKDNFVDEAKKQSIEIVKEFSTNPDETDFRTVIVQLKQLDIDTIYGAIAFYPTQGAFTKQLRELAVALPFYSTSGTEVPGLVQAFPTVEGTIYPYPKRGSKEAAFVKKYEEKFGLPASPSVAYAYDAVMLVADALRTGAQTSDDFAAYFASIKDYDGISNRIAFENGRVTEKEHLIKIVKNGTFVPI